MTNLHQSKLKELSREIAEQQGRKKQISSDIKTLAKETSELKTTLTRQEEARIILQEVAKKTQDNLIYRISDVVELCLGLVFPDREYKFVLNFVPKRNKTEAEIYLEDKDGIYPNITKSCGGGVSNVVALGLRISLWKLRQPKTSRIMILDEPFRDVSPDRQELAGQLLKVLSKRLQIQFIVISHRSYIINKAEKVFLVEQIEKESKVLEVSLSEALDYIENSNKEEK